MPRIRAARPATHDPRQQTPSGAGPWFDSADQPEVMRRRTVPRDHFHAQDGARAMD
jgi:hypothetical protein